MRFTDACERRVTEQIGAGTAKRRIGHYRHALPHAPWEHITLNTPVRDAIRDLIGRAAISFRDTEEIFHVADLEIGDAPPAYLSPPNADFSNAATTLAMLVTPFGQCNR